MDFYKVQSICHTEYQTQSGIPRNNLEFQASWPTGLIETERIQKQHIWMSVDMCRIPKSVAEHLDRSSTVRNKPIGPFEFKKTWNLQTTLNNIDTHSNKKASKPTIIKQNDFQAMLPNSPTEPSILPTEEQTNRTMQNSIHYYPAFIFRA